MDIIDFYILYNPCIFLKYEKKIIRYSILHFRTKKYF